MHDTRRLGGVLQAGVLLEGQRVDVRAGEDGGAFGGGASAAAGLVPAGPGLLMTATTPVPPMRWDSRPSAVSSCSIRSAVACSAMLSSGWRWKWR
ncbi:hypothetical protein A2U19_00025 [Dietzia maris]|uniref:hypothetical protein n=1 Tax=Dietzia papillomatosis TaxID=282305 RepID=UPI0007858A19|nr:hypothetical protein [Dietzia papillomatosis]KZO59819.1 hypothetical protein A2U19_00025 [Dietzia maris]